MFNIPGPTVLFVDPEHTLAAGNTPIDAVPVDVAIDCRALLNRIIDGALYDDHNVAFGPMWPWDPCADFKEA